MNYDKSFTIGGFTLALAIDVLTEPVGFSASVNVFPSAPLTIQVGVKALVVGLVLTITKGPNDAV